MGKITGKLQQTIIEKGTFQVYKQLLHNHIIVIQDFYFAGQFQDIFDLCIMSLTL